MKTFHSYLFNTRNIAPELSKVVVEKRLGQKGGGRRLYGYVRRVEFKMIKDKKTRKGDGD